MRVGYGLMLGACLLSAAMGVCLGWLRAVDHDVSTMATSFVRVLMNGLCIAVLLPLHAPAHRPRLLGGGARLLWVWGVLGALTVASYFASIARLGFGTASMIGATSGVFTTALSPWLLGQRNGVATWTALLVSLAGVYLLKGQAGAGDDALGWLYGVASGLTGGLAYITVARIGRRQHALTIMAYWFMTCLAFHLGAFALSPPTFPRAAAAWGLLLAAGLAAALSQLLMTLAYQRADAAPLAALSYAAPALGLAADVALFGVRPTPLQALGAALVVACGIAVPFFRRPGGAGAPAPAAPAGSR